MSKLARRPIKIPKEVEVKLLDKRVEVKGPKGSLFLDLKKDVNIKIEEDNLFLKKEDNLHLGASFLGLYFALIRNLILGVFSGFEKRLVLIGVGYRAFVKGNKLDLQVGFSHPTMLEIPKDLSVKVENSTEIIISGIDKQKVGQFAAKVRDIRPPEPYKGKGIRYKDEYVRKKAGKAAKGKGAG